MDKSVLFLTAIAIALIIASSDVFVATAAGENYYPFHLFSPSIRTLDFTYYSAIVKHVSLFGWVSENQLFELSHLTPSREWLPFMIAGIMQSAFGYQWIFMAKVAGSIVTFILAFLLFGRWMGNGPSERSRIALAALFALFPNFFDVLSIYPPELLTNIVKFFTANSLFLDRFHSPAMTLPFFLLALYFAFRAFDTGRAIDTAIAGIAAGLLIYTYFYYIAFFAGLLAVMLAQVWEGKVRKRGFREIIPWQGIIIFAIAAAVAAPYAANLAINSGSGMSGDLILRLGLTEYSRAYYIIPTIKYLGILLATVFLVRKRGKDLIFFAGMLTAAIIGMNLHLVTGFNLSILHWQGQVADQVSLFLAVMILCQWQASWRPGFGFAFQALCERAAQAIRRFLPLLGGVFLILILAMGLIVQTNSFRAKCATTQALWPSECPAYTIDPKERDALDWLKAHSARGDVVISLSSQTNARISADTGLFVFLPNGFLTTAKNSDIEERVGFSYRFFGVAKEKLESLLTPHAGTLNIVTVTRQTGSSQAMIDAEKVMLVNFPFHFLYHSTYIWQKALFERSISGWPQETRDMLFENGAEGNIFFYPKGTADRIMNYYENSGGVAGRKKITWVWEGRYERIIADVSAAQGEKLQKEFDNGDITIYRYIS
ncbi:MAG TPA: hypothetical protein HA254_07835 [Candidatus Diapherotrites archaeon]|uniref:Uncharacterized protein n=1 Tax=Candidatus Iainarchaeum sp. TaxID=3101447 RepID=A0A7J4J5P6_9ARCH|nr:hypothetical protein [Candidatus Diapherotrites archaeon]